MPTGLAKHGPVIETFRSGSDAFASDMSNFCTLINCLYVHWANRKDDLETHSKPCGTSVLVHVGEDKVKALG